MTDDATIWPDPDSIPDDPRDPFWTDRTNPSLLDPFPEWVTGFRSWQVDAVREIVDGFRRGAKVMVLDAPTGAGKTLIGEAVRRCGQNAGPATYLASTISLQHQFVEDFPTARRIMGAGNYPTEHGPPWVSCADCQGRDACGFCDEFDGCPYRIAKVQAMNSPVAVANTSYWLHETNHVPRGGLRGRPGLIIDECDTMENALMGFVELYVAEKWVERARVGELKKGARRDTVQDWFERLADGLAAWAKANRKTKDVKRTREVKDAVRMAGKAKWFAREWALGGEEGEGSLWVRDYPKDRWSPVVYRAVKVDRLGGSNAWKWVGDGGLSEDPNAWVLAMSATVISADEWIESNGFAEMGVKWGKVVVPSPFPVENRPVIVVPVADMKMSRWEQDFPALLAAARSILTRHPDDKVLVHTTSWKLNDAMVRGLRGVMDGRPLLTHTREGGAKDREKVLVKHRQTERSVLVSPSMDRGVDLPGDDCRVQIVCKVPYPYLGNRQIQERTRLPGGQVWFTTQTARTIVQMTGRGVRSETDHATTYVLDRQFTRWYGDAKRLLPRWWTDAVKVGKVREFL